MPKNPDVSQNTEAKVRIHTKLGVMVSSVLFFALVGCSPTNRESTDTKIVPVPPSRTEPAVPEDTATADATATTLPPTPEKVVITTKHFGPAFQDVGAAFDWQFIADIFKEHSNGMLGEKIKVYWSAQQPPADELCNEIFVTERMNTTTHIPGTQITPEMNIPAPSRETGAEVYLRITEDQIRSWIMADRQFTDFLTRLQSEETQARKIGQYTGAELPAKVKTRILGITEGVTQVGALQEIGVQFELILQYYPEDVNLEEVVVFQISVTARRPVDAVDFLLDEEAVTVTSWFKDLAAQRAAITETEKEAKLFGIGSEYAYDRITQNVRGENIQVGFGDPTGTSGVAAFPPIHFLDVSGQIDVGPLGIGKQKLALEVSSQEYLDWVFADPTLASYIETNFKDQSITLNVNRQLVTLVEYQIAEGEVLPGAVYSLPLELEFSGGSQMSVILQLTAIPSGTRLTVSGHTIEVFDADGQMISK